MENQLQLSNHNLSTPLNGKEQEIAKIIWHVNLLMNYPLNDFQIEAWSKSINQLRPNQDLNILLAVINMMKMGSIEFNSRLGIQNIFNALKTYDKIKIGYIDREKNEYGNYKREMERIFYYEDDLYPSSLIWIIDKEIYESYHLKPTIADTDFFLKELN